MVVKLLVAKIQLIKLKDRKQCVEYVGELKKMDSYH